MSWEEHRQEKLAREVTAYLNEIGKPAIRAQTAQQQSGLLAELHVDITIFLN